MKKSNIPEIETDRLILKKIKPSDQLDIHKGLSHPDIIKYYGVQYSSFEETTEQMNWYSNLEKSRSGMWWTVRLKDTGEFCGAIGFNDYLKRTCKSGNRFLVTSCVLE